MREPREVNWIGILAVIMSLVFWGVIFLVVASRVSAECRPYPVGPNSPTGIVGCEVYGQGTASWYTGPGAARNDCVYPWADCRPIAIRSLQTGITIITTPVMYCDCYTGTPDERLVDLTPALLSALGLDPAQGLFPVEVWPVDDYGMLPDTAMR